MNLSVLFKKEAFAARRLRPILLVQGFYIYITHRTVSNTHHFTDQQIWEIWKDCLNLSWLIGTSSYQKYILEDYFLSLDPMRLDFSRFIVDCVPPVSSMPLQ